MDAEGIVILFIFITRILTHELANEITRILTHELANEITRILTHELHELAN